MIEKEKKLIEFEKFLEKSGYSKITPSGNPSTCTDYAQRRIPAILERENISLSQLESNILRIIEKYDKFGSESDFGSKSKRSYINALKRFGEFLKDKSVNS